MVSTVNGQEVRSRFMDQMYFALGYGIEAKERVKNNKESISSLTEFVNKNLDEIRDKLPKLEEKVSKNPEKYKAKITQLKEIESELFDLIKDCIGVERQSASEECSKFMTLIGHSLELVKGLKDREVRNKRTYSLDVNSLISTFSHCIEVKLDSLRTKVTSNQKKYASRIKRLEVIDGKFKDCIGVERHGASEENSKFMTLMSHSLEVVKGLKERDVRDKWTFSLGVNILISAFSRRIEIKLDSLRTKVTSNPKKYASRIQRLKVIDGELKALIRLPKLAEIKTLIALNALESFIREVDLLSPIPDPTQYELFSMVLDSECLPFVKAALSYLVEKGCNPNVKDEDDVSLLTPLISNQKYKKIEYLLDAGLDPNATSSGQFALRNLPNILGRTKLIKKCLAKGFDVNKLDSSGLSIFHHMINQDDIEQMKLWFGAPNINCDVLSSRGQSPLHFALERVSIKNSLEKVSIQHLREWEARYEMIFELLNWPVDVNKPDASGETPLCWVLNKCERSLLLDKCGRRNLLRNELIGKLCAKGANPFLPGKDGKSPFELSLKSREFNLFLFFARGKEKQVAEYVNGDGNTIYDLVLPTISFEILKKLKKFYSEHNKSFNDAEEKMAKQMLLAARNSKKVLKDCFQPSLVCKTNSMGQTVLHIAAMTASLNVKYILSHSKPSVNVQDCFGNYPIHYAAERGHLDTVRLLIDAGARFDVKNKAGETPLSLAQKGLHTDGVKFLYQIENSIKINQIQTDKSL